MFARWLASAPKLLLLDEPTRGLDVDAKTEILRLVNELADAGTAVLLVSSELEELTRACDRYLVMIRGQIVAELPAGATREELGERPLFDGWAGCRRIIRAFATLRNSGALIVLVVTYVVFSIAAPSFFGLQNLLDIVHVISPMMIVATGMALVVMSGKLDISVGSIAYVASAIFALIMRNGSLSLPAAVAVSIWGWTCSWLRQCGDRGRSASQFVDRDARNDDRFSRPRAVHDRRRPHRACRSP